MSDWRDDERSWARDRAAMEGDWKRVLTITGDEEPVEDVMARVRSRFAEGKTERPRSKDPRSLGESPDARASRVAKHVRSMRRMRVVEEVAREGAWFSTGCAAMAAHLAGRMGIWLALAVVLWTASVMAGRRRTRIATQLILMRGEDVVARESLRAHAALTGLVDALAGLGTWADEAREVLVSSGPPEAPDPEKKLPPNPLPREVSPTLRPPNHHAREAHEAPPSHPALSREPGHDPKTCPICSPVESAPPGPLR